MSNDDELNRQYRDREDRKAANKEFNELLEAYHALITFESLQPITFDPAFFAARIKAIEAIGIEQAKNQKLLEASQLLLEFQRQKKLLDTLMDTVNRALKFVEMGERNALEAGKQE